MPKESYSDPENERSFQPSGASKLENKIKRIFFPDDPEKETKITKVSKLIFPTIFETHKEMELRVKKEKREREKKKEQNFHDQGTLDNEKRAMIETSTEPISQTVVKKEKRGYLWKLPEKLIKEVVDDFTKAFPEFSQEFTDQPIDYRVTKDIPVTDEDLDDFKELLTEEGTLMSEAYPFYELLTQDLSEMAAKTRGGIKGKVLGMITKFYGMASYKADLPVVREWKNIVLKLNHSIGENDTKNIIFQMYFGEKDKYQEFKKICEENNIDFDQIIERTKKESFAIHKQHCALLIDAMQVKKIAGALNLPGKILDRFAPLVIPLAIVEGLLLLSLNSNIALLTGLSTNGWLALIPSILVLITIPVIGTIYHEITHILGGNFRSYYQKKQSRIS